MLLALGAVAPAAGADSLLSQVEQRGALRIGTPGDYAPYSLTDTDQHRLGADVALAREIAVSLGLRAEFVPTSWSTLLEDARAGRFDIAVGGISITPERQAVVDFTSPYLKDSKQPVVRCGEQRRYDTRREIDSPAVRLIVNRGGTNEAFARRQFPHAALTVHADNRTVFEEITARRADVMVTDGVEARLQQARGQGLCAVGVGRWATAGKAILVRRDQALRQAIESALRAQGGSRGYARRLAPWIEDAAHPVDPAAARLAALIDERLALVTEVARYKWNTGAAVEDPPREQALLESLREKAVALGVPRQRVDAFFLAQIEAAKQLQHELFARWKRERREKFPGIAELATSIRPDIDRVTNQMLQTLASLPTAQPVSLPAASTVSGISATAVRTARAPLLHQGT
ncbi:MAG TPA: gamma subclass chorismate mutase AroQ [Steroidobacteraceae bacterium]|nr:gamma subclass chorismate mutase AroQ [Steroidobacteraceae bacterium]